MKKYINERLCAYKEFLCGKKCAVLGIGISNIPLIKFLLECGASVVARDKKSISELSANRDLDIASLESNGVVFVTGEDYLDNIQEEVVFKTPGIRCDHPKIKEAAQKGALITSEMEVFLSVCPCKIIAITGSDGKTTTTTLTAKLLEEAGYTVHLGGNIGRPLLYDTEKMRPGDFAVLELSSFQLHSIGFYPDKRFPVQTVRFPDVAIITNISPNHLDWHTSYEEYAQAKKAIFSSIRPEGKFVTNAADEITKEYAKEAKEKAIDVKLFSSKIVTDDYYADEDYIYYEGKPIISRKEIKLPGVHNTENYMAAIAATSRYVSIENVLNVARTFGGVEHRLEFVEEIDGVSFYNSSIDSSPTRTIAAIKSFSSDMKKKLILIMGGYDKNIPYAPVGEPVCEMARAVFLCGATAQKIKAAIEEAECENKPEIFVFDNFEEAVISAKNYSKEGECVILTPASASFDMFKNFEQRGRYFKEIVRKLK